MSEHIAKRSRLSMEEVMMELDNEESQPMQEGSDDEFEDITYTEKERDEYGGIELNTETEPSLLLAHSCVLPPEAPCVFPPPSPPEVASPPRVISPPEVASPPCVVSPPEVARPTPRVVSTQAPSNSGTWSTTLSPVDIAPFTQSVGPTLAIPPSQLKIKKGL